MIIENVILHNKPPQSRWDIEIKHDRIHAITASNPTRQAQLDPPSLILPSLCHPHIHLDKPYLLTCNSHTTASTTTSHPDYSDLIPSTGTFSEALSKTSQAKSRYTLPDLLLRGSQLLATSINAGASHIRAFVEIDHVTQTKCIEAAIALKHQFNHLCHIQIVAFAQDPIFSSDHGEENRKLLEEVLHQYSNEIDVLGTTPYVEKDSETGLKNIQWAIDTALEKGLHLDFHLDYHLDEQKKATVWDVVRLLKTSRWIEQAQKTKTIVLGHCSRMTHFSNDEMVDLAKEIQLARLPLHFVGLPTSDLFMMGRPGENDTHSSKRPRGTLQVLDMIKRLGFNACIGVNNVGNAFTPWGTGDPLQLACLGVGIYQAGTEEDAKLLYECVSTRARKAIGVDQEEQNMALLVRNEDLIECVAYLRVKVPPRQRLSIKDVVWDPPEIRCRRLLQM